MSKAIFKKSELNLLGRLILRVGAFCRLLHVRENSGKDQDMIEINNMTLINLMIKVVGPVHERTLTVVLMTLQVCMLEPVIKAKNRPKQWKLTVLWRAGNDFVFLNGTALFLCLVVIHHTTTPTSYKGWCIFYMKLHHFLFQVFGTIAAFWIRYHLASFFYDT